MLRGTFVRRVTELDTISIDEIRTLAASRFGDMIKGVVSMINLRPSKGNRSRGVDDAAVRQQILDIVARLVLR